MKWSSGSCRPAVGRRVQTSAIGCARQSGAVGCARQSGAAAQRSGVAWQVGAEAWQVGAEAWQVGVEAWRVGAEAWQSRRGSRALWSGRAFGCARQSGAAAWRLGGAERRLGGAGEAAELCGAAEILGVPLTITPLSELHRPDANGRGGIGWKGMEPKAKARMWRGAPGFLV